jgi:hypothetical protein
LTLARLILGFEANAELLNSRVGQNTEGDDAAPVASSPSAFVLLRLSLL